METEDTATLLAQLKDIHLPAAPDAPNLWPVYLSLAVCAAALFVFATRLLKKRRTWTAEALASLNSIKQQQHALQKAAVLLKRIALTVADNNHQSVHSIKQLHGDEWLAYLDTFYNTDFFSRGAGRIFGDALYEKESRADEQLFHQLEQLIKRRDRMVRSRGVNWGLNRGLNRGQNGVTTSRHAGHRQQPTKRRIA